MPETFWIEVRSNYLALMELVREVDGKLSIIIILSCANNMYFICMQLFNSFQLVKPYSAPPYVVRNMIIKILFFYLYFAEYSPCCSIQFIFGFRWYI